MITTLTPANEQFVNALNNLESRLQNVEVQASSGLRVNKASDAPQEIGDIFQARAELASASQTQQNLTNVKAQADAADSALQTSIQVLQQASTLAVQAANSTTTPDQQKQIAVQVSALLSQLVSLSRTQVDGVYIFSGDNTTSPSYQLNAASSSGVDRLITPQATQKIADPTGVTFQIAETAQDLFDKRDSSDNPAPENVFVAVNNLKVALQNGDQNGITQALGSIQTASSYLNQQLGFYGAVQNRIASALDLSQKFQVQAQTELSNLQDADVPAVATELTQLNTSLNAALAAQARRPTSTLFDYLPLG